jgi:hypothetical protein
MQGTISFHPIDVGFFEDLIQPLLLGRKVNPDPWVRDVLRLQRSAWCCDRYIRTLETLIDAATPPPPPEDGTMWERLRTRLERFDYRPDPASVIAANKLERDLHLQGRPFFITEGSADRVSAITDEYCSADSVDAAERLVRDQLARLDARLGETVALEGGQSPDPELVVRREMLAELKIVYDLGRAVERGGLWGPPGARKQSATDALRAELPWRSVTLASRAVPFWVAEDVDGLETICRAAGVTPPDCLVPAWRLFADASERYPELAEALHTELRSSRDVGAFVPPERLPDLIEFLNDEGARIIQAANQAGVGATCTTLLRKIRECARFAEAHDMGYLEASGVPPLVRD